MLSDSMSEEVRQRILQGEAERRSQPSPWGQAFLALSHEGDRVVEQTRKRTRRVLYKAVCCRNCGTPYKPIRIDQVHCSSACNKEASNRDMLRGRMMLAYAYNWRKARGKDKKEDFAAMCRELDRMIREDREAGRMGPKGYDPLRGE